jgi:hypothetical protein
MDGRTWSVAALLALAVAVPVSPVVAGAASAATTSHARLAPHGSDDGAGHSANHKSGKKAHTKFNLGGRITAVDAAAGSVTFRVHGGKFKALRGTELTVTAADGARIRRNGGAVTLADLVVGDHVRAKGVRDSDVWTAARINAEARHHQAEPGDDNGSDV